MSSSVIVGDHHRRHLLTWNQKIVPLLVLSVLQAADLFSTRIALRIPGITELNPLVRDLGLWQAKLLVLGLVVLLVWRSKSIKRLWAVCAIYALMVGSNLLLVITHARIST